MRKPLPTIQEWDSYFVLMNYTAPLPSLAKASELRSDTANYYVLQPTVASLLEPLQLKQLEDRVTDSTARYALLAHHALVLHAQHMHEKEVDIYAHLSRMDTQDWPMKRDAAFNRIRCLRECHLTENDPRKDIDLCQQILTSVQTAMEILTSHYSEAEWTRSTLIRDEKDFLLFASMEAKGVLGIPHSAEEKDLLQRVKRRRRNRQRRTPYLYGKFWYDHRAALVKFWEDYRPVWYKNRYREHYGKEPENEPIIRYPSGGCSIHPDYKEVDESKRFLRDAENAYRESKGLPPRGQGWTSETHLKLLVKEVAIPLQVFFEYCPSWLYPQRFDIFIPDIGLAIEYMGEQHYWTIEHFGGEEAFQERKQMDARKREAARANGITVLDWRYDEDINEAAVKQRLSLHLSHKSGG